jgi:hypothetical protein
MTTAFRGERLSITLGVALAFVMSPLSCGRVESGSAADGDAGAPASAACAKAPPKGSAFELYSAQEYPTALALDGTTVFWSTGTQMMTGSLCGDAATLLVAGEPSPLALVADANAAYWIAAATPGGVRSVARAGGTPTTLTTTPTPAAVSGIALDDAFVYYAADEGIVSVPKAGGAATLLSKHGADGPLAVDATKIYYGAGGVFSMNKDGSGEKIIAQPVGQAAVQVIGADDATIYFATTTPAPAGTRNDWVLLAVPKSGGAAKMLAQNEAPIYGIGATDTDVYWITADGDVRTTPKSGGSISTLASGASGGGQIIATPTAILWTEWASAGGVFAFLPK